MNYCAEISSLAPAFPGQMPGAPSLIRALGAADPPMSLPSPPGGLLHSQSSASALRTASAALIYVVDDAEGLTELYTFFLKGTGYNVRAFNERAEALVALATERTKPDLLIIDYLGDPMPADRFMQCCVIAHPSLRILMASGLAQSEVRFSGVRPDRFIQKPFTAEEFLQEVRAALAPSPNATHSRSTGRPLHAYQSKKVSS